MSEEVQQLRNIIEHLKNDQLNLKLTVKRLRKERDEWKAKAKESQADVERLALMLGGGAD